MYRRAGALAVLAFAIGCSAPPDKEYHQAEGALAAARAAGAETYAPQELETAETALEQYATAVQQRDYRQALRLALDARDTAYQAAKRAADEKAAARARAEQLMAEVAATLESARSRVGTGPAARANQTVRLRATIATAQTTMQEASAQLARQEYRQIVEALTPLLERLNADLTESSAAAAKRGR